MGEAKFDKNCRYEEMLTIVQDLRQRWSGAALAVR
jgi:hypothetical protein